jgi:hypothetical protein
LLQPHPDRLTCKLRSRHWPGLAWASGRARACDPAIALPVCTSGWRSRLEYHHVSPVLPRPLLNTPLIPVSSFNLHDLAGHNLFLPFPTLHYHGNPLHYRLRSLIPSDSPECVNPHPLSQANYYIASPLLGQVGWTPTEPLTRSCALCCWLLLIPSTDKWCLDILSSQLIVSLS